MKPWLLLTEDDDSLREVLSFNLTEGGFQVEAVSTGEEALKRYMADHHSVVLTDLKMPGIDGIELLRRLRGRDPQCVVVVMTAYGSVDVAVSAMQEGAFHYVEKPVNNRALLALLRRAVEYGRLGRENRRLQEAVRSRDGDDLIIATSPEMNRVLRLVDKVADSDATLLIRGESGTGKELIARAAHRQSGRNGHPFITVNCAAVPGELLESLLFGHEKGAFTGATQASPGKFMAANKGTLFLDEIGEMSAELQAKLLRVLQDGEIDVVGSAKPRSVDVRIIAATHRNLELMVKEGRFREDLYYRLNVIPITIPALRERREDIPVLFRHFLRKRHPERNFEVAPLVDEHLINYHWPGNVRELENITERMALLADGQSLSVEDVPSPLSRHNRGQPTCEGEETAADLLFELPEDGLDLLGLEMRIIEAVLQKTQGNQSAAARYLKIPRHVLLYRMEKYGLK